MFVIIDVECVHTITFKLLQRDVIFMMPESYVLALDEIGIIDSLTRETITGFSNSAEVISAASVALSIFALGLGGTMSLYAVAVLMISAIFGFRLMNLIAMQDTTIEPDLIQNICSTHNSYLSLNNIINVRMKLLDEIYNLSYKVHVIWMAQLVLMVLGSIIVVMEVMV